VMLVCETGASAAKHIGRNETKEKETKWNVLKRYEKNEND